MKPLMAALGASCLMFASPALAGTIHIDAPHAAEGHDSFLSGLRFASPKAADARTDAAPVDVLAEAQGRAAAGPAAAWVTPTSRLPEPTTWAAMLAGFGIAGASLRRGRMYRLVEHYVDGTLHSEEFPAPDDDSALERALSVADGGVIEVWRGAELVRRLEARPHVHA